MLTWRKGLFYIGIVWLVIVIVGCVSFMINTHCSTPLIEEGQTGPTNFHCGPSFLEVAQIFFVFGLPSWILFLIATLLKNKK